LYSEATAQPGRKGVLSLPLLVQTFGIELWKDEELLRMMREQGVPIQFTKIYHWFSFFHLQYQPNVWIPLFSPDVSFYLKVTKLTF